MENALTKNVQLVTVIYNAERMMSGMFVKRPNGEIMFLNENDLVSKNMIEIYNRDMKDGKLPYWQPVKFYLICDDKIKKKDLFYHLIAGRVLECAGFFHSEQYEEDDIIHEEGYSFQKDCRKVIATHEQVGYVRHLTENSPFVSKIEEVLKYINAVLSEGGNCKIEMKYCGAVTNDPDTIISEIEAGQMCPKLIDGKVVIVL
jgi:hypothetical protein